MTHEAKGAIMRRKTVRRLASYASYTGVLPPPVVLRPAGISAITIAKNEELWAELSVRSVMDTVDEVIVADHGSDDRTAEVLDSLAKTYPGKIRLCKFTNERFDEATNQVIERTRFRWILRWHADFIARTTGPSSLLQLRRKIEALDRNRHFCINLSGIALDGDLEHQFPDRRDKPEPFVYTYSPWLRYGVRDRWESLEVPWFYEKLTLGDAFYFHMRSVKPPLRILQKLYWSHWFDSVARGNQETLREYTARRAREDFGTQSVDEAARAYEIREFRGCIPFSRELCGDYPDLLKPLLGNPPFRLVFKDGKLVDRVNRRSPSTAPAEG